jgi:hypothetical protein
MPPHASEVEQQTRNWVERLVIGLSLCPFAARDWQQQRVRCQVSHAGDEQQLLLDLHDELLHLQANHDIETTLLIHPQVLNDFTDYNNFLDLAEALIESLELVGEFQLASVHPHYCFADAPADDPANASNRSPWPMLHLLREASLERALASHENPEAIPERNVAVLRELGEEGIARVLRGETRDR